MSNRSACWTTLMVLVACDSGPSSITPPEVEPPLQIEAIPGTGQTQTMVGTPLPGVLVARVRAGDKWAADVPVTWATTSGEVNAYSSVTDHDGYVRARWILGGTPGSAEATASLTAEPTRKAVFSTLAVRWISVIMIPVEGVVRVTSTPNPRVLVTSSDDQAPRPGITIAWEGSGSFNPAVSTTGTDGMAVTMWTPSATPGPQFIRAVVTDLPGYPRAPQSQLFEVIPGPAEKISLGSSIDSIAVNSSVPIQITGEITDEFDNLLSDEQIEWSIEGSEFHFIEKSTRSDSDGRITASVVPGGSTGLAEIRALARNGAVNGAVTIKVTPPAYLVRVTWLTPTPGFLSLTNGTRPAVDTIPVGSTVIWKHEPFDYDVHAITIEPMTGVTGGGQFPYGTSTVAATFTVPGTYRYEDPYSYEYGTVVVQ